MINRWQFEKFCWLSDIFYSLLIYWVKIFITFHFSRKLVHHRTVETFPGNDIPLLRSNGAAKRKFEDLVKRCVNDYSKPDLGYDECKCR